MSNVRPHEPARMIQMAIDAGNREAVRDNHFDCIVVYVYFVPCVARDVTCPECGEKYTNVTRGVRAMWWDEDHGNPGQPMLVCTCGEQFTTQLEA